MLIFFSGVYILWIMFNLYINKLICIVSLRKILYSLQRGSNHGPLALGASIIPRDHRAVQKISWISCYIQGTLIPTGLGDIGLNARATVRRKGIQTRPFFGSIPAVNYIKFFARIRCKSTYLYINIFNPKIILILVLI